MSTSTTACATGQSGCEDDPAASGVDEPDGDVDGQPGIGSGQTVNGGLTVSEALSTDATGILAVQGYLFDDGSGLRLCEALAESFPPQCPGVAVDVGGVEAVDIEELVDPEQANLQTSGGVTWTDSPITLFGELSDGILTVDTQVVG